MARSSVAVEQAGSWARTGGAAWVSPSSTFADELLCSDDTGGSDCMYLVLQSFDPEIKLFVYTSQYICYMGLFNFKYI